VLDRITTLSVQTSSEHLPLREFFKKVNVKIALSYKLMMIQDILLQPLLWCCVDCVIHHERDVREEQKHMYVARTSYNRVIPVE